MAKVYTQFQTKTAKNTILWGCTYLYGLYKGVPPAPRGFGQIVGQIFSVRVKKLKLSKTNWVASMHIKRGNASLTVDVRRSKAAFLCTAASMIYFRLTSGLF